MTEREKVIADLNLSKTSTIDGYAARHYGGVIHGITTETLCDALALLKAQEPRVMTLEEVRMLDRDYYYLEAMRSPGKELREILGTYGLQCVTWPSITWARQTMGDRGYGKTWRCWTSRPTDEQREAVPWN